MKLFGSFDTLGGGLILIIITIIEINFLIGIAELELRARLHLIIIIILIMINSIISKLTNLRKKVSLSHIQNLQVKMVHQKQSPSSQFLKIPKMQYKDLQKYLLTFFNSKAQQGRVNGQHITFVTGAQNVGKTQVINMALQAFKSKKNKVKLTQPIKYSFTYSPQYLEDQNRSTLYENQHHLIINFDFHQQPMMNIEAMLHHFHQKIIEKILNKCTHIQQQHQQELLNQQIVLNILTSTNSQQYLYIFLKDTVYAILQGSDILQVKTRHSKLQELNEQMINMNAEEFFKVKYSQLIEIIAEQYGVKRVEACLRLFLSVFKRIQFESRPSLYINQWYQSGIHSTEYLFEILNYLCGFGKFNDSRVKSILEGKTQIKDAGFVGTGNHIDVVMVLSHLEHLTCYGTQRYWKWFDHICARLHNSSNLRTHFPLVIELGDSYELNQLQKHGRMLLDNPTVMQISGYFLSQVHYSNLPQLFDKKTLRQLFFVLGRNPTTWNKAIFQLANGTPKKQILTLKADYIKRQRTTLEAKLNRIYLDPINLPYLDDNTLKFHVMTYLSNLKKGRGFLGTHKPFNNAQFFDKDMFRSFYQNKILFQHFYQLAVDLVNHTDIIHLNQILKEHQKKYYFQFRWWKLTRGEYFYRRKQLSYNHRRQLDLFKQNQSFTRRFDYQLRWYNGPIEDNQVLQYELFLRKNYHV